MKYILIFLFFSQFATASENPYTGAILFIKGKASISVDGGFFGEAQKGDLLSKGDEVKTGDKSLMIIRFPDKSTMRIEPNSHIKFESIVERLEEKSLGSTSLILKAGRSVINVINKSQAPVFKIKTKSVAVGVRGTKFYTGIDNETNNLDIAVQSGEVEVENLSNSELADAVEAGQGLTIEKGENFTQPKNYDWVNNVNYNAEDKTIAPDYLNSILSKKRLEFRQKREAWRRNKEKWLKKKSLWSKRKSLHQDTLKNLKSKRKNFLKNKSNFLRRKKSHDLKRDKFFKSQGSLKKQVMGLKGEREKLKEDIKAYRKGKRNPTKAAALLRRKQNLDLKRTSLQSILKKQKGERLSFLKERKNLLQNLPPSGSVGGTIKEEAKKKRDAVKERQERKVERKIRTEAKDKLKKAFGF